MKNRQPVRSLFVSDVHLGCRYANAGAFLDFLRAYRPQYLYIVGDFFDGWQLKKSFYWNDTYNFIIKRLLGMMKKGTKILYAPGNHDEFLRKFVYNLGSIEIQDEFVHEAADGRKLLIVHGDKFDSVVLNARWLSLIGDMGYNVLLHSNIWLNFFRRRLGFPYWSLSGLVKRRVKQATNVISDFENVIARYARNKGCQGVICGHIHTPVMQDRDGIAYYNTGDWVESCSAIIEHLDGRFELIQQPTHFVEDLEIPVEEHDADLIDIDGHHLPFGLVERIVGASAERLRPVAAAREAGEKGETSSGRPKTEGADRETAVGTIG